MIAPATVHTSGEAPTRPPVVSVIIPTRDPHPGRLHRTLSGLVSQSLDHRDWELIVVDNGSAPPLSAVTQPLLAELRAHIVIEPEPGLTPARLAGIRRALGEVLVFVDDDNVLSPGYLSAVSQRFTASPSLAAAGGPVIPEWEAPPPPWTFEFHGLLALRDLGAAPQLARGGANAAWPDFAPVGAGLAIRRTAALAYADTVSGDTRRRTLDRSGASLASGGDNDLVFTALHAGGDIGYFPELQVVHLIPSDRVAAAYLARLNEGIQRTWVRVLALHGQCPWAPIAPWTVPLRAARAWFRCAGWLSPARHVRWRGLVGRFYGQSDLHQHFAPRRPIL